MTYKNQLCLRYIAIIDLKQFGINKVGDDNLVLPPQQKILQIIVSTRKDRNSINRIKLLVPSLTNDSNLNF